jgi:hypothetical protein
VNETRTTHRGDEKFIQILVHESQGEQSTWKNDSWTDVLRCPCSRMGVHKAKLVSHSETF